MATLERYNSFEEMDKAQKQDYKNSNPVSWKKKKASKETSGQKLFREFGELLRKGIVSTRTKRK